MLFFAVASRVILAAGLVPGLIRRGAVLAAVRTLPLSLDAPRTVSVGAFLSFLVRLSILARWWNDAKATDTVLMRAAIIPASESRRRSLGLGTCVNTRESQLS
ncbi:MAG: hypothetical protein HY691_00160 [Chloroflexi bacterium]|nr:hypothetical protein [Chloroflexota bacterium]